MIATDQSREPPPDGAESVERPGGRGGHIPSRRWRLLPAGATGDAATLLEARAIRAFADGFVSVLLPLHLTTLGLGNAQIGLVVTATLVGSAALTLFLGLVAFRYGRRALLLRASLLMVATGLGFAFLDGFWPLLAVALVGTINPTANDVSVFLPTEQALLSQTVTASARTALFARYSLVGALSAAFGSLAAALPEVVAGRAAVSLDRALDGMFVLYALIGLATMTRYVRLSPAIESVRGSAMRPLGESRGIVYRLAAVFSIDSFAGGFIVQSLIALWLFERFDLSVSTAGAIFFWSNLLAALSQLAAPWLAARIGLINTMVFTHLPANVLVMLTPFMPSPWLAVALLLARSALSQMDIPARQSYVMAVVSPEERPAAASVTNVPRSLAAAGSPFLSGYLLSLTTFGWPLLIGGALKAMFQKVRPPEEGS
ncbi:MAG: MFS transporter [Thermomicrobiales bacterium]